MYSQKQDGCDSDQKVLPAAVMHPSTSRQTSDSPSIDSSHDSCYDSEDDLNANVGPTQAEYQTWVEFALKLGYTQAQLDLALTRLNKPVQENDLLAELISITTTELSINDGVLEDVDGKQADGVCDAGVADTMDLRPIVIDGSNVALSHGNKEVFSCHGIQLAVDWFVQRGHTAITAFVPQWRKEPSRADTPITGQDILLELERVKHLVFTPSRRVSGKRIVCYDDRYIVKLAADNGGIVVSNDNYRDLIAEKAEYRDVVEQRLLMYSFVNDRFMPPDDPLGRRGPSLDTFLQFNSAPSQMQIAVCPYARKCTYGAKCRFRHPERGQQPHRSVVDRLQESAIRNRQAAMMNKPVTIKPVTIQRHASECVL